MGHPERRLAPVLHLEQCPGPTSPEVVVVDPGKCDRLVSIWTVLRDQRRMNCDRLRSRRPGGAWGDGPVEASCESLPMASADSADTGATTREIHLDRMCTSASCDQWSICSTRHWSGGLPLLTQRRGVADRAVPTRQEQSVARRSGAGTRGRRRPPYPHRPRRP